MVQSLLDMLQTVDRHIATSERNIAAQRQRLLAGNCLAAMPICLISYSKISRPRFGFTGSIAI